MRKQSAPTEPSSKSKPAPTARHPVWRFLFHACMAVVGAGIAGVIAIFLGLAIAYPRVPDVSSLAHYSPKQPLRILTADGQVIGEFGEERRSVVAMDQIPKIMRDAVLAAEDARFYEHGGVDYIGVIRAAIANLGREKSQGASTITMQVARNVYLSSEKTYTRKLYEFLLTMKLEHSLTKDQILEIYMNQIYLGNRAYGFATAAQTYFGKPLQDIDIAQAAMLAGIPKSPSAANPIANFERAKQRQQYVLDRMADNDFITRAQADEASKEQLQIRPPRANSAFQAGYVAEMVRQIIYAQYGEAAYSRGLNVYTSINPSDQEAATAALRRGVLDYSARQRYRGPEKFVPLPKDSAKRDELIDETLADLNDIANMEPAVVLSASPQKITAAVNLSSHVIEISGKDALMAVWSGLQKSAPADIRIRPGAVIRVIHKKNDSWITAQPPEVEGAFVAMDPNTGAIRALVGGFDFNQNEFNHVTQAWRQPGSSFKPFIYSAALEKGFSPNTIVNDAPLTIPASMPGGKAWTPKNYGGSFLGPMTLMQGLAKSRNLVAIRVLQAITPRYAQGWITHFGFDAKRNPAYLPMALGAGEVTPLQMVAGYSVFANGGHYIEPYLIQRITDQSGRVLVENKPEPPDEGNRVISARNAFVMDTMLQEVAHHGTAARAQRELGRPDIYGKTGTTNDSQDAWFVGFQPNSLVAATWIGFDQPKNLGPHATGGGLALPIWIDFMRSALKGVPVATLQPVDGVVKVGGNWVYSEYARGGGVNNLGGAGLQASNSDAFGDDDTASFGPARSDERQRILDLFRN